MSAQNSEWMISRLGVHSAKRPHDAGVQKVLCQIKHALPQIESRAFYEGIVDRLCGHFQEQESAFVAAEKAASVEALIGLAEAIRAAGFGFLPLQVRVRRALRTMLLVPAADTGLLDAVAGANGGTVYASGRPGNWTCETPGGSVKLRGIPVEGLDMKLWQPLGMVDDRARAEFEAAAVGDLFYAFPRSPFFIHSRGMSERCPFYVALRDGQGRLRSYHPGSGRMADIVVSDIHAYILLARGCPAPSPAEVDRLDAELEINSAIRLRVGKHGFEFC